MISLVLGTRPEIIKLGPVANKLDARAMPYELVHTGQHFDDNLSQNLLDAFELSVDHQFEFGGLSRGAQLGAMTTSLTTLFEKDPPKCVVVQGDTNSVLAAGLAANAVEVPLVHVEAGLRSYDRAMPEEHNRVMVDHIADVLFAPTEHSAKLLFSERVSGEVLVTGNTEMDAVSFLTPSISVSNEIAAGFGLTPGNFIVATIHRPENTESLAALERVVTSLIAAPMHVLFATHPRTAKALSKTGLQAQLDQANNIVQTPPLDPQTMWALLQVCAMAVSDSGGIQEDVTVFGTPLLVVRNSTERPEVLGDFARLCTPDDDLVSEIAEAAARLDRWRSKMVARPSPYLAPDGGSPTALIVDLLELFLSSGSAIR